MSRFPGSKNGSGVYQAIIGQMPPHRLYVEPFFGTGAIFWRKRPSPETIIIDKDPVRLITAALQTRVTAIQGDALELLPSLAPGWPAETVCYADPPYLHATRQGRLYYDHELTDADHARLLDILDDLPCCVLLSGYRSPLYDARLKHWRRLDYRTRTSGKTVIESLWCNQPEPEILHDWRFAGRDFRERYNLARLARRWKARLKRMPSRKRGFLIHELATTFLALPAGQEIGAGQGATGL